MTIFRGLFRSLDDVQDQWGHVPPTDAEVVFAEYDHVDWEGYARIAYVHGGKIFLVEDSHCSCVR